MFPMERGNIENRNSSENELNREDRNTENRNSSKNVLIWVDRNKQEYSTSMNEYSRNCKKKSTW